MIDDATNPAALLAALKAAYSKLIAGEAVARTEYETGQGTRRRLEFHPPDLPRLEREIQKLEAQTTGKKPTRVIRFSTSKGL